MSPIPLIARQRALSRIGEIRCGDEKQDGKVGRKLDTFRLTSQHREILERAAELYGGHVKEWDSPTGKAWQVITERSVLRVLALPGYSLRRSYEKWDGPSKRVRICDGEEETLSGEPCMCNAQGQDECKILTRLMVLLPETGTSLGWQLSSTGETAADELAGAMQIAEGMAQGRPFVPARLRLTQRRGQLNGQATRFVVPVLEFDPTQPQLATGELPRELPSGYKPIEVAPGNGVTLEAGLAAAEQQTVTRTARSAAPIPAAQDIPFGDGPVPVPSEDPGAALSPQAATSETAKGEAAAAPGNSIATSTREKSLTKAQQTKLGVLVRELRDEKGLLTTEQLYAGVARNRKTDVETQIAFVENAYQDDGLLHFGPLMQTLTRGEASTLIDQLESFAAKQGAA